MDTERRPVEWLIEVKRVRKGEKIKEHKRASVRKERIHDSKTE